MPTINTKDKLRIKNLNFKIIALSLAVGAFSGCLKSPGSKDPKIYARQADRYYEQATSGYKSLISNSKSPSNLYFELGMLYYNHGELDQAIDNFKKSEDLNARKFIAISYFKLGNYTDALEYFSKPEIKDEEYLYYKGLTCERLNLFDQAISTYKDIKKGKFKALSDVRLDMIEKGGSSLHISKVDSKINKIILNCPEATNYPQAGALILLADEKIEVTEKNTQESQMHYLVKVLNERGKEDFSEAAIEYDSTFEKVELEYARTIKPDGTVVNVGSRHIRDLTKYLNFPLYSNAHVFIISFPEVAIGSFLEYKIKIKRSQLINKNDFVLNYSLQSHEPVIQASFSVILPKERHLNLKFINEKYNTFGSNLKPLIENNKEKLVYNWQFKNIPEIVSESDMPADVEINPSILISTFGNWKDFYAWWWDLAKAKIIADENIKLKVKALIKDKPQDEDKIRAIYNFCAKEIRYVAIEYGQAGFEPHAASDIFKNKYGDCKDQAVLLVTMLKEAGFQSYPVLISTKSYYNLNPDFPSSSFNHCIAAVYFKNKYIFLDPTAETCPFGDLPTQDQNRKVILFKPDGYCLLDTPMFEANHNLVRQELYLKVNNDETISAKKINSTFGVYDQAQRYWLLYTQPELIQEALKKAIQDFSIGAKLDNYNIDNLYDLNKPVKLSYNFNGPEYFTIAGNLRIMPQLSSLDTSFVAKEKRKYPIDFSFLGSKETILEIQIPKDFKLKYLPESIERDSPWTKFIVQYTLADKKIIFKQKTELKKEMVNQEEYLEFKKFIEDLARSIKQRVVLEKEE